jgi:diaminopimelate epimerase
VSAGRRFYKMSGSGNDFVFFDLRDGEAGNLENPQSIAAISARGTGIGSDGVVFLRPDGPDAVAMRYYNSDGSLGELCGNATLCTLRLANRLGIVGDAPVSISTDAGVITARMSGGLPEIDLAPVTEVLPSFSPIPRLERESRLGFARVGVPHITIVDSDNSTADIRGRGSAIRRDRSLKDGANVNFVTRGPAGWSIRTYERGVEGETLACGTGAVASAILLTEWGEADSPVSLRTRSGRTLDVRVVKDGNRWLPSLRGAADLVFSGELPADFA